MFSRTLDKSKFAGLTITKNHWVFHYTPSFNRSRQDSIAHDMIRLLSLHHHSTAYDMTLLLSLRQQSIAHDKTRLLTTWFDTAYWMTRLFTPSFDCSRHLSIVDVIILYLTSNENSVGCKIQFPTVFSLMNTAKFIAILSRQSNIIQHKSWGLEEGSYLAQKKDVLHNPASNAS